MQVDVFLYCFFHFKNPCNKQGRLATEAATGGVL